MGITNGEALWLQGNWNGSKRKAAKSLKCNELILLDEVPGMSYEDYNSVNVVAKVMEITGGQGVNVSLMESKRL